MTDDILSNTPPFSSLPKDELDHLRATLPKVSFSPGEIILREGLADDKFFILMDGQVEIIKSLGSEDERHLGIRGAGTLLGEMSLFNQDCCHSASVRALTPLTLLSILHADLDALLLRYPKMSYEIIRVFSNRLTESENMTILDLREKNKCLEIAYDELKTAHQQIIEKEKLEKELDIASQIQRSILPECLPQIPGYDIGALMVSARQVGGDFYTFLELGPNKLGIVVGDVCDKGIPASLFMALSYSLIRAEAILFDSPVETLRNVNFHLLQMNAMSLFVTLVYGILDCESGDFHFARVAHPAPFLLDRDGEPVNVPVAPGQPLGIFDQLPIDEQHIHLSPGGMLLLYSDGVNESQDLLGREFGEVLLDYSVSSLRMRSAQGICDQLFLDVQFFGEGLPQQDDFTVVVIKRLSESP